MVGTRFQRVRFSAPWPIAASWAIGPAAMVQMRRLSEILALNERGKEGKGGNELDALKQVPTTWPMLVVQLHHRVPPRGEKEVSPGGNVKYGGTKRFGNTSNISIR